MRMKWFGSGRKWIRFGSLKDLDMSSKGIEIGDLRSSSSYSSSSLKSPKLLKLAKGLLMDSRPDRLGDAITTIIEPIRRWVSCDKCGIALERCNQNRDLKSIEEGLGGAREGGTLTWSWNSRVMGRCWGRLQGSWRQVRSLEMRWSYWQLSVVGRWVFWWSW